MNNKLLGYDEAVGKLQELEKNQRLFKKIRLRSTRQEMARDQKHIESNKNIINMLLSIIAAHKQARKLFEQARYYKEMSMLVKGCSND